MSAAKHNMPLLHDTEAEAQALGCILHGTEQAAAWLAQLEETDFLDHRHAEIFRTLIELDAAGEAIDTATAGARLVRGGKARQRDAGGIHYMASLPEKTCSPANFPALLAMLKDLSTRRRGIADAEAALKRFRDPATPVELETKEGMSAISIFALERPIETAASELLANRYLCRKGGLLLVGPTGIGKSSLSLQCMLLWALGKPCFGVTPARRLKSLIIQAENDDGDLAEMRTAQSED